MPGINSLLNLGQGALFAEQAAIHVTGNNIANVNTAGYSRQTVRFDTNGYLDYRPGQIGLGTRAAEIIRHFDSFIERSYVEKNSKATRWEAQYNQLLHVEGLFNEANSQGVSALLSSFLNSWGDLSPRTGDIPTREALLSSSQSLANAIRQQQKYMRDLETRTDELIAQDVDNANMLMQKIADLNKQIKQHHEPGYNNANTLLDQRDQLVRELSTIIDINLLDRGGGDCTVMTLAGHTLVDSETAFELQFKGPQVDKYPINSGTVPQDLNFSGHSYNEYTVEIVTGGTAGDGVSQFKVSYDGGKTWLSDEYGNPRLFDCNTSDSEVVVDGLGISFGDDPMLPALAAGDRYVITPKSAVYWVTPTSNPLNISPQLMMDGTENSRRMTGGSLAGYLAFRDYNIGQYQEMLNNTAQTLIWEVNRLHSQGVGLVNNTLMQGEFRVQDTNIPLGADHSGLAFGNRLQEGNVTFYVFDAASGKVEEFSPLDFGGGANFDPAVHTLQDVADAINDPSAPFSGMISASIINNQLQIVAAPGYEFAVSDDSSGLMAALGLNTFFSGDSSSNIGINSAIVNDLNRICAGAINGGFEGNIADNATSNAITALGSKSITIPGTSRSKEVQGTLGSYYSSLVGKVGTDTATARFNGIVQRTMANDLDDRQNALAGVNLDEEMTSLIKFQNSYKAAAKLITTADQMFQTLLGLKQ